MLLSILVHKHQPAAISLLVVVTLGFGGGTLVTKTVMSLITSSPAQNRLV